MEFASLIKKYDESIISKLSLNWHQRKVFSQLKNCRTAALGGHLYVCENCGETMILYNSCRNRNCPVCQGNKRNQWIEKQCADLLNISYSHVIFTIPDVLNNLFLAYPKQLNNILFRCSWQTLKVFFRDEKFLGGKGGMTSILHTWGQTLALHPHAHCIVPAAGLDDNGNFIIGKTKNKFLFPVKALSKVFRAKFVAELTKLEKEGILQIPKITRCLMFRKNWVVFSSPTSRKSQTIVNYLGRYTYRAAIAESRIISDENGKISFSYKNYKTQQSNQIMKLSAEEFFRRYAMHIFPYGFVRIRHYGVMSNSCKKQFVEKGTAAVGLSQNDSIDKTELNDKSSDNQLISSSTKSLIIVCPKCKKGLLRELCPTPRICTETAILAVNSQSGEIIYRSRDGPYDDNAIVLIVEI